MFTFTLQSYDLTHINLWYNNTYTLYVRRMTMLSFRAKLTAIIIIMVALSVLAAGLLMLQTYRENHINILKQTLERELLLISAQMDWPKDDAVEAQIDFFSEQSTLIKSLTDARVTYIRGDGIVVGDSNTPDVRELDNHRNREEIIGAMKDGIGYTIRGSTTFNKDMLYVAIATTNPYDQSPFFIRLSFSLAEVEQSIRQLTVVMVVGLAILFVIAALASYRIALSLTRPIEHINQVAKKIKSLDYRARVEHIKQDEIGELAQTINSMAESLQVQMTRIKQNENHLQSVLANMINGVVLMNESGKIVIMNSRAEEILGVSSVNLIGKHYTQIKQQYELLQLINEGFETHTLIHDEINFYYPEERLLELNLVPITEGQYEYGGLLLVLQDVSAFRRLERMRSEFVANVSHELKTPIAAVKGFSETLLAGAVKDEETAMAFLQIIYDESERLNRLIGDILELSKIESRRTSLMLSPVELNGFLKHTIQILEVTSQQKNITVTFDMNEELYIEADEDRLRQIFVNLLSNAINYTPEDGQVTINVSETTHDTVAITISDTGVGIPDKDLPRIFERFYRVDKARSRNSGGTGLGLSIVKHLVDMHKGQISVSSKIGKGSTFIVELPVIHS